MKIEDRPLPPKHLQASKRGLSYNFEQSFFLLNRLSNKWPTLFLTAHSQFVYSGMDDKWGEKYLMLSNTFFSIYACVARIAAFPLNNITCAYTANSSKNIGKAATNQLEAEHFFYSNAESTAIFHIGSHGMGSIALWNMNMGAWLTSHFYFLRKSTSVLDNFAVAASHSNTDLFNLWLQASKTDDIEVMLTIRHLKSEVARRRQVLT